MGRCDHPRRHLGALWCPSPERVGYAGFRWPDRSCLSRTDLQLPLNVLRRIEGFHGNFVAVPRSARQGIGPIDGTWPRYYADLDYALRAERAGAEVWLLPRAVGDCDPSPTPQKRPPRSRGR